jgi:hypothetical protein
MPHRDTTIKPMRERSVSRTVSRMIAQKLPELMTSVHGSFSVRQVKSMSHMGQVKVQTQFVKKLGMLAFETTGRTVRKKERSRFLQENPNWIYTDIGNPRYRRLLRIVSQRIDNPHVKAKYDQALAERNLHHDSDSAPDLFEATLAFFGGTDIIVKDDSARYTREALEVMQGPSSTAFP